MKLKLLEQNEKFIVIDEDNYLMPYEPINNYLIHNRTFARNSIKKIAVSLMRYFHWLDKKNLDYRNVIHSNIIDFRDDLRDEPDKRTKLGKLSNEGIIILHPKGKKANTINEVISCIRGFYDYLECRKEIAIHPCPLQSIGKISDNHGMLAHTKKGYAVKDNIKLKDDSLNFEFEKISANKPLTREEMKKLFSVIDHPQEVLLICMLLLGMRISEALGRRTSDISWMERKISIVRRNEDMRATPIKYNSQRIIPIKGILYFNNLPDVMYMAYKQYVEMTLRPKKEENLSNHLFINISGTASHLSYNNIKQRVDRKLKEHFKEREITFHTFRHHYATSEIALGTPLEKVQTYLGHKNLSTTITHYYNPTIELLEELYKNKVVTKSDVDEKIEYLIDYKKRFCKS